MSRTKRDQQLSNREQKDYLDNQKLQRNDNVTDDTEIITQNKPGGKPTKVSLGVVLGPLTERVEDLEAETLRLEQVKADKCYTLAMAIVL